MLGTSTCEAIIISSAEVIKKEEIGSGTVKQVPLYWKELSCNSHADVFKFTNEDVVNFQMERFACSSSHNTLQQC